MRSLRFVVALCAISLLAAGCDKITIYNENVQNNPLPTAPTAPPTSTPPSVVTRPGDFVLSGSCVSGRARLSWTRAERADGYSILQRRWTTGVLQRVVAFTTALSAELPADPNTDNYWQVVAKNSAGETRSNSPGERDDKTVLFACGAPRAPVSSPPPATSGPTPPGTTPPPTGTAPPPSTPVITCVWNGPTTIPLNQTVVVTATCTDQNGQSYLPAWFSSEPSRVEVRGSQETVISGQRYQTGNSGTIRGIARGSAVVSVQAAIDRMQPVFSRTVTVE